MFWNGLGMSGSPQEPAYFGSNLVTKSGKCQSNLGHGERGRWTYVATRRWPRSLTGCPGYLLP
jgi:hypothetical protein